MSALAKSQVGLAPVLANKDENGVLKTAARMGEVRCPVLVIWGEQDRLLPRVQGERWRDAIDGAELEELADTGHHPQYDKPEEVAGMILESAPGELSS
ncbi:MAG: alpha/beta hydrolase [Thermoleophilaceae bacterium]|nr:alpha/beta hydrolase [Thermoleophilaceae bacterium]